ncbi:dextranase-like [Sitodiplosis mosellana]|uniref:dextranase-like n=1 Tax=Sitodiplosis mosellana TaxID=263140 RepID=UPI0024441E97|nr:dextranase-like [Sitodiplosis mosellana]
MQLCFLFNLVILWFYDVSDEILTQNELLGVHTWWHSNHELNARTPVADNAVRRSPFYNIWVATIEKPDVKFDSFVYMSIPRGGRDKWGYSNEDGAEFSADEAHLTMSWSSFLYDTDSWVYVQNNNHLESATNVTIRPSSLKWQTEWLDNGTIRILVPYSDDGFRFSIEFESELYTAYNDLNGVSGKLNDKGFGRAIHTEPRNAILVFAESFQKMHRYTPNLLMGSIYYVKPGLLNNLDNVTDDIIYFRAGVYYMPWNYHAKLTEHVKWIYFEPGSFVKGAFQFLHDAQNAFKFTGFGVLSGEKYVYEADTNNEYRHKRTFNCHGSCVKLLRFSSAFGRQQSLTLAGVTFVEPPYHSFVVHGDEDSFEMLVENFKMVGAWYWQTDGIELYTNGKMKNTFFHSNDDVLKIYHGNLTINNTVIWKNENGPVVQWGWSPRNITNVFVNNTFVIHNKMYWSDVKGNTCILNSSPSWSPKDIKPDPETSISDLYFENLHVEGMTNCAIRLYALSNTNHIKVKNFQIDGWNDLDATSQASKFQRTSTEISIGANAISFENFKIGNQQVSKNNDNWDAKSLGRLDFDAELYKKWNAV